MDDLLEKIANLSYSITEDYILPLECKVSENDFFLDEEEEEDFNRLGDLKSIEDALDYFYQVLDNSLPMLDYYPDQIQKMHLTLDSIEFYLKHGDSYKSLISIEELWYEFLYIQSNFFQTFNQQKWIKKKFKTLLTKS